MPMRRRCPAAAYGVRFDLLNDVEVAFAPNRKKLKPLSRKLLRLQVKKKTQNPLGENMPTLERTQPIGHDWVEYLEYQALSKELASMTAAAVDFPIARGMLQKRRDTLHKWLTHEVSERLGRYEGANIDRRQKLKNGPTIETYQRLIVEATADLERIDAKIASFDAHDLFQATWTGEIAAAAQLRERIKALGESIENHPSKSFRLIEVPEFITL